MEPFTSRRCSIALCALCSLLPARVGRAQQEGDGGPSGKQIQQNTTDVESGSPAAPRYDEVTVTATPPRSLSDLATPTDVLTGQQLQQQMQSTLGQTL